MKESFLLYKSFYEPIKNLCVNDKAELLDAIFQYQIEGIEPTNTSRIYPFFLFFKNQFRLDEQKYLKIVERNKSNGNKGGRPKTEETQVNPNNPLGFLEPKKPYKDKDKDNENEKGNGNEKKKFIPPTLEEVTAYFEEEGYSPHTAKTAFHFYTNLGWKDSNGKQVKNWKMKMLSVWMKEENKVKKITPPSTTSSIIFPR